MKNNTMEICFTQSALYLRIALDLYFSWSVSYFLYFSCVWMNKLKQLYKNAADIVVATADTTSLTWAVNNFQQENFQEWRVPKQTIILLRILLVEK